MRDEVPITASGPPSTPALNAIRPVRNADFVMVFTVRNGKITQFQEFLDSAALNAAFAGAGAAA